MYLKAGPDKAALLVAIGVKSDGHKVVPAVTKGYRESVPARQDSMADPGRIQLLPVSMADDTAGECALRSRFGAVGPQAPRFA